MAGAFGPLPSQFLGPKRLMDQNTDQTPVLQELYKEYLSENIQLKEERALLRLRIAELEEQISQKGEDDSEATS